jgi:hypothetical protein
MIEGRVIRLQQVSSDAAVLTWPPLVEPGIYAIVRIDGPIAPALNARMVDFTGGNVEQMPCGALDADHTTPEGQWQSWITLDHVQVKARLGQLERDVRNLREQVLP